MVHLRSFIAVSTLAWASACASSTSSTGSSTTTSPTCDELQDGARTEVSTAIAANLACTTDADCITIELGVSGCFDSCSRTVAASGKAAVDTAKTKVDGAQCQQFRAKGCTAEVPPCAPASPPRCDTGTCK